MAFFEWGVALHDLDFTAVRSGEKSWLDVAKDFRGILGKARRQIVKDYILWPVLSGPSFLTTLAANFTANVVRNVWSYAIIFCGHFPDQTYTFTREQYETETRGGKYVRQLLGAANIDGSPLFHVISGNLGYQVEHHLYPGHAEHALRRDRTAGARDLRALRPSLQHGPVPQAAGRWCSGRSCGWPSPAASPGPSRRRTTVPSSAVEGEQEIAELAAAQGSNA